MAILELICYQTFHFIKLHTHTIFIVCLTPHLRHDYSEAVDFKLLENFSAAQPFNAKLCVEAQYMRSFGTQSPDDGEVLLPPLPFSHPHASDLGTPHLCQMQTRGLPSSASWGRESSGAWRSPVQGQRSAPPCPCGYRFLPREPPVFLTPTPHEFFPHVPSHPTV